jgi:hypothetical protein
VSRRPVAAPTETARLPVDLEKLFGSGLSVDDRLRVAWTWAESQRRWYSDHGRRARISLQFANVAALVLSVVTPILILVSNVSPTVRATPAALAAIVLGATTTFSWRDNWIRWMQTSGLLENEQLLFVTGAVPYDVDDPAERVARFVANTGRLTSAEYASWGAAVGKGGG